jgi:threonyl-tRNA synthetase
MEPFDHKRLGRELEIFHFDDRVGRGLPLWLPKGVAIRDELERFLKELEFKAGFQRVSSPHIARESLYMQSGHLPYYAEGMYPAMKVDDGEVYRLRPMNCPHHHLIYSSQMRSYRMLPLRLAEFGHVYRLEASGALSGLLRVRGMCQNDAHIYCRKDQVKEEFKSVLRMHLEVNKALGINGIRYRLSSWDPANSGKYPSLIEEWEWSQEILREAMSELSLPFDEEKGEAAFYGPKIDLQLISNSGSGSREESFSTVQLDFVSAARMELDFINADGAKERPYIIHRAPLGTHERLVAFLLEMHGGHLPSWLSPVQVSVLAVSEAQAPDAMALVERLRAKMIRAEYSGPSDSLSRRIRDVVKSRVANLVVIGEKEKLEKTVMLRSRKKSQGSPNQICMGVDDFESWLEKKIRMRVFDI